MNYNKILDYLDSLAVLALSIVIIIAFAFQLSDSELPCALCVMQRMGFYLIAYGLILNLIKGRHLKHYLMVIIVALINGMIGLYQVLLHIVPGTGGYGGTFLSLHMYTWGFILSMLFIMYSVLAGLFTFAEITAPKVTFLSKLIIGLLLLTLIANIISAFVECGPHLCPSSPENYWLIDALTGRYK